MSKSPLFINVIDSPLGPITTCATTKGICMIHFGNEPYITNWLKIKGYDTVEDPSALLQQLEKELTWYFGGTLENFSVPLDLIGTDFQIKVWNELLKVPYGSTRTYAGQAKALGDLKAIRAVATANGKNNIAIVVPCHRIIGTDGSLTGYAGGLDKKKWLLDFEAKHAGKGVQQEIFG